MKTGCADSGRDLVRRRPEFLPVVGASFCAPAAGIALEALCALVLGCAPRIFAKRRKVVVVTFGGGARDQETFAPEGQENIPHMLHEMIPQSTFFTQW